MKNLVKISLLLLFLINIQTSLAQEVYTLNINGEDHEIVLNETYIKRIGKDKVTLKLTAKDTLYYEDELFSFAYLRSNPISKVVLDEGIEQVTMMTAEGTGVILQKFSSINPVFLNEMMLDEVTKESLNYGFDMSREEYQKMLKSGQTLTVDKAVLNYQDEVNIYEVSSFGQNDQGILIMTMAMDEDPNTKGKALIELIWSTLIIK